jgi:hypothetical protein
MDALDAYGATLNSLLPPSIQDGASVAPVIRFDFQNRRRLSPS